MKTVLIIGGGPAGCAAARCLSDMGDWDITLVERAPFLGAGARTFWYGGHPYTYGPRHLLFHNERHFYWLMDQLPLRRCNDHQFKSYVAEDAAFYNFPIHYDDIPLMPEAEKIKAELFERSSGEVCAPENLEDYWLSSVGSVLYNKLIKRYTEKMWLTSAKLLDTFKWSPKGVTLKSGPRAAWDTAISAYPVAPDGYNEWFDRATAGATVLLSTEITRYDFVGRRFWWDGAQHQFDVVVSTISPDVPFGMCYGALQYIGRQFYKIVLPVEFALPPEVYWVYEAGDEKWTRLTEFKKFTHHKAPTTLLGLEVPIKNGRRDYPNPTKKYQALADRYYGSMGNNVYCLGRNGSYRYSIDIAACIDQAHELVEVLRAGGDSNHVVGEKWRA